MNPEREVEIKLWDWFKTKSNDVKEVYFNSENEINAPVFRVEGEQKKPNLIIEIFNKYGNKKEFIAVEVKDGTKSIEVIKGRKIYDIYLLNYIKGKTKYFIGNEEIKINHFAVATQYSINGRLMKNETLEWNERVRGASWGNKNVFRFEYNRTKENHGSTLASYSEYRKNKKLYGVILPSLGVIVSDVLRIFDFEELRRMPDAVGKPIFQCIRYNKNNFKNGGFKQCLMKI